MCNAAVNAGFMGSSAPTVLSARAGLGKVRAQGAAAKMSTLGGPNTG